MNWYESITPVRLRCMVKNSCTAAAPRWKREPLWALVGHIFAEGSTHAAAICRLAELDPDAKVSTVGGRADG